MNHYDIAYGLGVGISSPFWLARPAARKKVLSAFSQRMGKVQRRQSTSPAIMIHAVSLGEINATRTLVEVLRKKQPGLQFIVSTTTVTGFEQGVKLYGKADDVTLIRYPLDFSSAIDRVLTQLRPNLIVLLELELWPNFMRKCAARNVPVVLINGRITEGSFRKYRMARPIVGGMFQRLRQSCVQDSVYASRFAELGVPQSRLSITGTMKFDTAQITDRVDKQDELAEAMGLIPGKEKIWVCGSTGPGEEQIILEIYKRLRERFADLRLVIVPRKPERFNEVATLIGNFGFPLIRRSEPDAGKFSEAVILIDTMGELRKCYGFADVVFVGRTLVDLGSKQHGSDMIEPSALGKPVIVGPYTGNFADAMSRFLEADAIKVAKDAAELERFISEFLSQPQSGSEMGRRARKVVASQQGATEKHAQIILDILSQSTTGGRP